MALPTPDQADHTSMILAQETAIAQQAYSLIEVVIGERYTRGNYLDVTLPAAMPTERSKQMVRDLCGSAWDVKFDSTSQYNEATYFVRIRAADEVAGAEKVDRLELRDIRDIRVGDAVIVPDPNGNESHNHSFVGTVTEFRNGYAFVRDGEGDVFWLEIERLTLSH